MKLPKPELQSGVVAELRKIRDQISEEIKDMTFEEIRAYLDRSLGEKANLYNNDSDKSKQKPAA